MSRQPGSASYRLGFALELGHVRYVGTFLRDPLEVPTPVVDFLAAHWNPLFEPG